MALRATLKMVAFLCPLFAAVFSASAGYGLLGMLVRGMTSGANVGMAEFATHSSLTIVFFVLAGSSAYAAKKCYW
jgi:hypothetical protein